MATQSETDVLIIGAGPAGLMMAVWMSRYGIRTRIVDKRGSKIYNGHADGLQSRTLEVFESFGFGHRATRETNSMLEICFWNPDENGVIQRSDRIADNLPGNSRYHQCVVHQGRIERFLLDSIREHSDIRVDYAALPSDFKFDESKAEHPDDYPVTVTLEHLPAEKAVENKDSTSANGVGVRDGQEIRSLDADDIEEMEARAKEVRDKAGKTEIIKARYMLGSDGAHSWVRRQIGLSLDGDSTDYIWGVLDIIPITDFPDIRMRCAIHSASSGTVMVIPREHKLVRLYIQLTTTEKSNGGKADRSKINPDVIIQAAQRIMAPYKISYRYCDWWTAYQIGQRLGNSYSLKERVFLAGDAVHTHSPKAGQGMNVSMADTYNLGWKLASVLKGICQPSILKTYQWERRRVAQNLIDFDHRFSRLFSGRPAKDVMDEEGVSMDVFKAAFAKSYSFLAGTGLDYGASMIVARDGNANDQGDGTDILGKHVPLSVISKQSLATKISVGSPIRSFQVLNQADARPWQVQELLPSNGKWRLVIFAGNIKDAAQNKRVQILGKALAAPDSFVRRFKPQDHPADSVIEILAIHSAPRKETTIFDFPEAFRPWSESNGWDYWKIYVDDESYHQGHGHAYENYGIDPTRGCAVVLRPDQHVSFVCEVDDYNGLEKFFSEFMVMQHQ